MARLFERFGGPGGGILGRVPGVSPSRLTRKLGKQKLPTKAKAQKLEEKGLPISKKLSKKEQAKIKTKLDRQEQKRGFKPIK